MPRLRIGPALFTREAKAGLSGGWRSTNAAPSAPVAIPVAMPCAIRAAKSHSIRLTAGQGGAPGAVDAAERFGISVEDRKQHLADYQRTDGTKALATLANFRLLEPVVPKRRLAGPSELAETDFVAQERLLAYEPRHGFTGGEPGSDAPLQISHRKRLEVLIVELSGDVHGQLEKRLGQAPVDGA